MPVIVKIRKGKAACKKNTITAFNAKNSTKKAAKEFQTNKELDNWQIVAANKIKDGDGVIMKISHRPIHVGIYIEPSKYEKGIIHTEESTGVIYSNFYNLKKNHWFIDKFLRHISKI